MKKGFTLIELLVVIAVLGILASVVLVAINPSERIKEANDSGAKNDVSQVATALESFFTNNTGTGLTGTYYKTGTTVVSGADLVTLGYLKRMPTTVVTPFPVSSNGQEIVAYAPITAASAVCATGSATTKYWVYRSATGVSRVECLASAPTAP